MKKLLAALKTLSFGTWLRTILQILVYANQFVIIIGQSPIGTNPIYQWISFILTIIVTLASYWYNNDWTKAAKMARQIFDIIKDGKVTDEEIKQFIDEHQKKPEDPIQPIADADESDKAKK